MERAKGTALKYSNCFGLESAKLPSNLTKIPASTFYSCSLKSIEIPAGVTEIGETAFYACYGLTDLTLPAGLQTIGTRVFSRCSKIAGIILPETVISIGEEAFYRCNALAEIDVPAAVESISEGLFANCAALKTVTLHEGLTAIGKNAFGSCTSLESLELPATVKSLGVNVVPGCSSLQSITSLPAVPPACPDGVFSSANYRVPLFVNPGSVSAYKAAPYWRNFSVYSIGDDPTSVPVMDIEGIPSELEGATYATLTARLPLVWTSDNEDVAIVSNNGVVTAVAPGTATITAAVHNHPELADSHTLTVTEEVSTGILDISYEKLSVTVRPGVIGVNNVPDGDTVRVYTLSGTLHAAVTSVGDSISISVEPGKIYIVALSGIAVKVASR